VKGGAATTGDALVVRAIDYREADKIVSLLTRDLGRVSAMARGARKSRKRFGGALSALSRGRASLAEGQGELMMLEAFEGTHDPTAIAADVAKVAHAAYVVELAYELCPPRQPEPLIFDLVTGMLDHLAAQPAAAVTLRWFELALLEAVGLAPVLDRCVSCGGEASVGVGFDPDVGGVVCRRCRGRESLELGAAALERVRAVRGAPGISTLPPIAPAANAAMRDAILALLARHLPRPLRSLEFLQQLRGSP
jgi:DNA repair protein RecO (recombination protein O)